jgi:hypothetical protein
LSFGSSSNSRPPYWKLVPAAGGETAKKVLDETLPSMRASRSRV